MGICSSSGVIRDFAGPYFVSEDLMAFGNPTKYWQLVPQKAHNGQSGWDAAVAEASEIYKKRMVFFSTTLNFIVNIHSNKGKCLNMLDIIGWEIWLEWSVNHMHR